MGFNYLQTDDRDDYFDSLRSKQSVYVYTLIDPHGKVLLEKVGRATLKKYCNKKYDKVENKSLRESMEDNGFKIIKSPR